MNVDPESTRLQVLSPFPRWDGNDFERVQVLVKAKGKCTTDHIFPAGPWLRFRGHLERLSDNAFLGAVNAFTDERGEGLNQVTGERAPFPQVARYYKDATASAGSPSVTSTTARADSREHAAMSPRLLGCKAVIVRSFARIHETNLKKQGVLPLTFSDPDDYDKIFEADTISITNLADIAPGKPVRAVIHHFEGGDEDIELNPHHEPRAARVVPRRRRAQHPREVRIRTARYAHERSCPTIGPRRWGSICWSRARQPAPATLTPTPVATSTPQPLYTYRSSYSDDSAPTP